ncbi:hypothetical protein LSTR_LSTR010922 [Laodelphax striatellus]|uniref:C2H2-type domain-containing protein n=1 Tax=Laodelphax striatellus TaxID=195883 RepID=A0A482WYE1_LAOST|nr:hypothetical protein LSTR_LSTR010922 [Laodelphax striatellus]
MMYFTSTCNMNDGSGDIYPFMNLSSLVTPAIDDSSALTENSWQISAESKDEGSSVVALDDGRFVLQSNDGQLYLLSMSSNFSNEEEALPEIESEFNIPNAATIDESEAAPNSLISDDEPKKGNDLPDSPLVEVGEEKFLFLCAQCSDVFWSVEQCRNHMIKDHNMIISDETADASDEENELAQLPLQPIDTNSSQSGKSPTNSEETATVNEENDKEDDQENSGSSSVKNRKCKTTEGNGGTADKEGNRNKEQKIAKVVKVNSQQRKQIASDPDYDLRPFKCKHSSCVHRFRSEEALAWHTACHTTPTRREYACSQPACPLKFDDWRHCAMHLWLVHQIDICGQHKAPSRKVLEVHMRIHRDEREFACPDCGKAFKQQSQMRNHRVTHIRKKEIPCPDTGTPRWYMEKQCEICLKMYADSKCLKKHVQAVHSKLRPYVCQVCGHSAARKAMLQAHLRQHTGEKPYHCNTCSFKTGDHNSLRRHRMRHSGVRPYKCPHCSYASIQSTSLKNHLAIRHPGKEGVFQCQRCSYRTVSHASYLQHLSDHNNNLINSTVAKQPGGEVEVFPENVAAAQLIYRCLSKGGSGAARRGGGGAAPFKADVTASSTSGDGTKQTITIEIPTNSSDVLTTDDEDTTHCFLQPDEVDSGGITIPADTAHPLPIPDTNRPATAVPTKPQPQTNIITHLIEFS